MIRTSVMEMVEPRSFKFEDNNGFQVSILQSNLKKHPDSFLNLMTAGIFNGDCRGGVFKVKFDRNTLFLVASFYENGVWPNLYMDGNQLDIDEVTGCIDDVCDFLGLPSEPMEDVVDDIQSEYSDYDYDFSFDSEDDFDPFEDPIDYYDDEDDYRYGYTFDSEDG